MPATRLKDCSWHIITSLLMSEKGLIKGFSKLSGEEKITLVGNHMSDPELFQKEIKLLHHPDPNVQELLNSFSENTLANFPMPYGVAPNFRINDKTYLVPMVAEESSVVAAASSAARFWFERGGFHAEVIGTTKIGQLYFTWNNKPGRLKDKIEELKQKIMEGTSHITSKMKERGGGITGIELIEMGRETDNIFQLRFSFNTADAMGANFINSVLEEAGNILEVFFGKADAEVLMAILSNYTPDCRVKVEVRSSVKNLSVRNGNYSGEEFANRFVQAVRLSEIDKYRAVTHNKGIFNGIDAVLIATGNDYRAAAAAGHAWASRSGEYSSLSYAEIQSGDFVHGMEIPLSLGAVGGLTQIHPVAKWSFDLLGQPGAEELMMIAAAAGLANNYAAIRSLVTVGIQKGHMKMHLENILSFLGAIESEKVQVRKEFESRKISQRAVADYLVKLRTL